PAGGSDLMAPDNSGLTRAARTRQSRRCRGRPHTSERGVLQAGGPELTEEKMFGGLAFLVRGNMAIAASSEGGAMVRGDPAQSDALMATSKAMPMNMRGRNMPGWLRVSADNLRTDDQLAPGSRSAPNTRALPPK